MKCGIVGLPNVGKSTLFNALTKAAVPAENYPFCTVEPNVGVVAVPDARLAAIAAIAKPQKVVPAAVEFVDIAGLVAGASKGEGLGNQFLSHIRETDAIAQVVRCFDDPNVAHVTGNVDPVRDIETVATELALADLQTIDKQLAKHGKVATAGDKEAKRLVSALRKAGEILDSGRAARSAALSKEELAALKPLFLLTLKPVLYVANVGEKGSGAFLERVEAHAAKEGVPVVPINAALEAQIADMPEEDRKLFLEDMGMREPGLARLVRAAYRLLGLQTFFTTTGAKEARAWTVPAGASALQAAGAIHTDFARGFIRAEVASYDDYVACGGEHGAREAGKLRLEGKDYTVRDGDVIHFRFNV